MKTSYLRSLFLVTALASASSVALAHGGMMDDDDMGPGMMGNGYGASGGYGPGMMSGGGMMGGGYGPGMMGGYGYGMMSGGGMMGGYANGMMGGFRGNASGMMGGYGAGMMGNLNNPAFAAILDLTPEQQQKIQKVQVEQTKQQWDLMQKMQEQQQQLQKLYSAEQWDVDALGKAYDELFKLRKEGIMNHLKAHKEIESFLNADQQKKLMQMHRFGYGD